MRPLTHPQTGRVFAAAHGTAYALWLVPEDFEAAIGDGLTTVTQWSGGTVTDLADAAGDGWIWGQWHADEPDWVRRAYAAGGPPG